MTPTIGMRKAEELEAANEKLSDMASAIPERGSMWQEKATGIRVLVAEPEREDCIHMTYLDGRSYAYNLPASDLHARFEQLICFMGLWQYKDRR